MPPEKTDISKIAHRILRQLKLCQCLVWLGIWLVLFVLASSLFAVFCHTGLSPASLNLLAWTGFLGSAGGCIYGAYRACNDERLFPLMKANLLKLYPDQRKYFDAWLATELYAPDGEATWRLLNRRLQEQVPAGATGLKVFPAKLVWFLIPGMLLVLSATFPGHTQAWVQIYSRRLMLGHDSRPLHLVSIKPERRWVLAGEPFEMNLLFDREVEGDVRVDIETTGESIIFDRKTSRSFHATLPAQYKKFSLNVSAERLQTERLRYRILPPEPITLKSIAVLTDDGDISKLILPRDLPADVPDCSRLRIVVAVAPGPWESFGLGSRRHGEILLTYIGLGGDYQGEVTLSKNDNFFMFWQLPGRSIEQSPSFSLNCLPNQRPQPVIQPTPEGSLLEDGKTAATIEFSGTDDDDIDAAWLWVTDYYDMLHKTEVSLPDGPSSTVKGTVSLDLGLLPPYQGRVLGLCMVMRDTSRKQQLGASTVVNLLLPEGELSPENQEKMRQFWEHALARQTSTPPGQRDAIKELMDPGPAKTQVPEPKDHADSTPPRTGSDEQDGQAQAQDGQAQAQDGQAQAQDGQAQAKDGQAQAKDGQAQAKDGQAQAKDGQAQAQDGQAQAKTTQCKTGKCQGGKCQGGKCQGGQGQAQGGQGQAQGGQGQAQGGQSQAQGGQSQGSGSGTTPGGGSPDGQPGTIENPDNLASGNSHKGNENSGAKPDDTYAKPDDTIVTTGSKKTAKTGDDSLAEIPSNPTRPGDQEAKNDPEPDSAKANSGALLDAGLVNGRLNSGAASSTATADTSEEHQRIMKKLTPEERRKLREYYRHLRDLK